jgi:hypothetical protein
VGSVRRDRIEKAVALAKGKIRDEYGKLLMRKPGCPQAVNSTSLRRVPHMWLTCTVSTRTEFLGVRVAPKSGYSYLKSVLYQ